jgi:hypothetical protein
MEAQDYPGLRPGLLSARAVQISAQMAFWTAQLAECVEENVDKRNQVGAVAVLPSIHLHQSQGGPRPLNLSSRQSVAQRRDLRFHFRQKRMCRGRIASRFRFSIKANRRSLGYARDDKVEGGGPPWHEWRWMDRVEKKLIWTSLTFSRPCGTEFV